MIDRHPLAFGALLILLVCVAYAGVPSAGFIWDDDAYFVNNANLRDLDGLKRIWLEPRSSPQYYPLVFTSFWIERQVLGPSARSAHIANIAIHALNGLLLWQVLRRLGLKAAYVIALVFALHPVQVESVAWITERKNVLSGLFYLSSALAYLAFESRRRDNGPVSRAALAYAAALALFACALLSKTVTATLPVALLLVLWATRGALTQTDILAMAPLLVLGAVMGLGTAWLEVHHVGASGGQWALSPLERVLLAGQVTWFYARTLVWPHPLSFIYPRWTVEAHDLVAYVPPACVVAVAAATWYSRRAIGRWPFVGVAFFLITLFPASGFLNVYPMRYSWVADHFQYLASIGVIALVVGGLSEIAQRTGRRATGVVGTACLVTTLVPLVHHASQKYRDVETLWLDTIEKNDTAWIAYNNLGKVRVSQGRTAEARALLTRAIELKPDLAEAHNNLGTALLKEGDPAGAIEHHARAVGLMPTYAEAHNNLGVDCANLGRFAEALEHYRRALALDPDYAMAHYDLANLFVRMNRLADAEAHYREAVRLRTDMALAHYQLGLILLDRGQNREAVESLEKAFSLRPDFAEGHVEVANRLLGKGLAADAIAYYSRALKVRPDYAEAHCNLGSALMHQGRTAEAIEQFRAALAINPRYAFALNNLGFALEAAGRAGEAQAYYTSALEVDPGYAKASENLQRLRAFLAKGRK